MSCNNIINWENGARKPKKKMRSFFSSEEAIANYLGERKEHNEPEIGRAKLSVANWIILEVGKCFGSLDNWQCMQCYAI